MRNCQETELDMMVISMKKAQKCAQEMPLEAKIRAREAFIEPSNKRIEQFDVERAAEVQRLEESQKRLEELRAMVLVQTECRKGPTPADGVGSNDNCRAQLHNSSFLHFKGGKGRTTFPPR